MMLTKADGKALLKVARDAVASVFSNTPYNLPQKLSQRFSEKRGVFVTIYQGKELRGCIGFPEPVYALGEAVIEAARAAAFRDPRFMALTAEELPKVRFEVSVLSVPELVSVNRPEDYLHKIKVGEDGLIVRMGMNSGLLLPQVAQEHNWSAEEFLCNTCQKAGLALDEWRDKNCRVYRFQAQVFSE
jgi:hypothetical protein